MLELNFFVFLIPAAFLTANNLLGLFPGTCIWLIQNLVGNIAWIEYSLAFIILFANFVVNQDQMLARTLLTFTPLAMFSIWHQITIGVDAIHQIESYWDEHRGPLYPELWYSMFSLYDPHTLSGEELEAIKNDKNMDDPTVGAMKFDF